MLRILVVDDDDSIRGTIAMVLEDHTYLVDQAACAEDALALFEAKTFDLVISDVRMPGLSGLELLQKIKFSSPGTHVIIITAYSTKDHAVSALKAGASDYIEKPITDLGVIIETVARVEERIKQENEKNRLIRDLQLEYTRMHDVKRQLETAIISDSLTGLYNRSYLDHAIQKEISRARRYRRALSVAFLDLDNFKTYNDTLGHGQGDELLRQFGQLILDNIRNPDIAARYGGDEFIIILPEADEQGAFVATEKIRKIIAQTDFTNEEQKLDKKITMSGGVAMLVGNMDGKELMENADRALYLAKAEGRNRIKKASEFEANHVRTSNAS